MEITNKSIDNGKAFDWGRTSDDYAKYRDIYPPVFYEKIAKRNLCIQGQRVLDLGTGTGVLQEICISLVQNGLARIFRKGRFYRRKSYRMNWG